MKQKAHLSDHEDTLVIADSPGSYKKITEQENISADDVEKETAKNAIPLCRLPIN